MATANAATFDGTNDYLTRGADYTGAADSKLWMGSFWFKRGAIGTAQRIFHASGGDYVVEFQTDNTIRFSARDSVPAVILTQDSATAITDTSGWHHICWSFDMAGASHIWVDDADDEEAPNTYTDATIEFITADHAVGAQVNGTSPVNACLSEIWMEFGDSLDLSVEANRRKFISAGLKAVDLGSDGSKPTGTAPILYLANGFATFQTNLGTGGSLTENGELTTCTGPEIAAGVPIMRRRRAEAA